MKNRAFTLIELLVVVLIIGILAAIALPQYQKAVLNSRLSQNIVFMDALKKGAEVYYMTNGTNPKDVRDIDIDITDTAIEFARSRKITGQDVIAAYFPDETECMINSVAVGCLNEHFYLVSYYHQSSPSFKMLCCGMSDNADSLCKEKSNGIIYEHNDYLNADCYDIL